VQCGCRAAARQARRGRTTHPKMRSGWAIKSVMRSSMLLGSSTNVGKVTLERSMPTLRGVRHDGQWVVRSGAENGCRGRVRTLAGK
jgi:hypothetical protein